MRGLGLDQHAPVASQQLTDPAQQCDGLTADAHAAVEQQGGAPGAPLVERVKDRALQHLGPPPSGEGHRAG